MRRFLLLAAAAATAMTAATTGCSSSSTGSTSTTAAGATATGPVGSTATAGGGTTAPAAGPTTTFDAAEVRSFLIEVGDATPAQADCVVKAASTDPAVATMFAESGTTPTVDQAQQLLPALDGCFGGRSGTARFLAPFLEAQVPKADATCLGTAMATMSATDLAALLANQPAAMSAAGEQAVQQCTGGAN